MILTLPFVKHNKDQRLAYIGLLFFTLDGDGVLDAKKEITKLITQGSSRIWRKISKFYPKR